MLCPFFKGKAVFFFLSSLLYLTQYEVVSCSPQGHMCFCMHPFVLLLDQRILWRQTSIIGFGFKNTWGETLLLFDWSKQEPASFRQHTVQPCSNVSGFEFLQTSASCKRPYLAMKQSAKMPGKEHYNLEHSSLECSRFLIRQKLDGWMFFQRTVERNIV